MQVIKVNGVSEVVSDYYDGLEVARDIMGDQWYSFMRQELLDGDELYEELNEEIQEYKHSEESLIEEYQSYLHEIQDLAEQCMKEEVLTGPTTKRMERIYNCLDTIKNICFKNT